MKSFLTPLLLGALSLSGAALHAADVPWWTFTGGGGLAQHGAVALGGAIGPIAPALAPATGGNYTLTGGFWAVLSNLPQPASPLLTIKSLGNGNALLSWPVNVTGFILEYTTEPGSGVWQAEKGAVTDTATEHTVVVATAPPFRCFRLRGL